MEYKNKTSKEKKENSKSLKTEGRMEDQDIWPTLPLAIYLDTIKDRNGEGLTEAKDIRRNEKNTQKNCTERILMTQITTMLWSLSQSQTFWSRKSSGP